MPRPTSKPGAPSTSSEQAAGVRLQRVMADSGVASRRDCEEMITRGLVEVNGRIVDHLPAFVDPAKDRIVVDGRPLKVARSKHEQVREGGRGARLGGRVYVMLHKPDRVLCTTKDEIGEPEGSTRQGMGAAGGARTTVADLVQHPSGARLYPAGRLEYHTTGLVLLTNDGVLADRLTHARYGVTRTYRVTVKGRVSAELLGDLRRRLGVERSRVPSSAGVVGRVAGGRRIGAGGEPVDSVRLVREPGQMTTVGRDGVRTEVAATNSVIELTLREGKSRQLRAIFEQMGAATRKLTRTAIGPLRLRGVAVGQWRDLTPEEVETLMRAAGLRGGGGPGGAAGSEGKGGRSTRPKPGRAERGQGGGSGGARAGAEGRDRRSRPAGARPRPIRPRARSRPCATSSRCSPRHARSRYT
ncbi:MAG: pseudouridine synthase [Phycisphaerales bacterium]